jgi:hypothetical protein
MSDDLARILAGLDPAMTYRSPVRQAVEGDTVNPNYTEVRSAPGGPIQSPLGFNEPLASRLPSGAMDVLAGLIGPRAPVRVPNPIKAYHGSPHDFDAFDLSKIGTGEGAQAYGHGLYFAEHEPVAKGYRDNLAGNIVGGKPFDEYDWRHQGALTLHDVGGDPAKAIVELRAKAERNRLADPGYAQRLRTAAAALERGQQLPQISPGKMYEVALHASPESFLDWDKPLSGQPAQLQDAYRKLQGVTGYKVPLRPENAGEAHYQSFEKASSHHPEGPGVGAVEALREAGIPGIRYLDQGSRAKGEGSSNYVVWSPEIIEILRKYGLAAAAPVGGATLASILSQPSPTSQEQ